MISCNTWVISATLSFIAVLLSRKWSMRRCILRWVFSASVFIFFHNRWVVSCTENVHRHSFMIIERWSNFWCRSIFILHLYIMNWIFLLSNARFIVVSWLWISLMIMFDSSSSKLRGKSLMKIIRFNILSLWWQELRQNTLVFNLLRVISRKNLNHEHSLNLHANYI